MTRGANAHALTRGFCRLFQPQMMESEVQCVDTCIKKEGTMCQPKGWSENEGEKERLMLGYYYDRQLDEGKE